MQLAKQWIVPALSGILVLLSTAPAWAQDPTSATSLKIDTGDTAWVLLSAALVMLMTPGLAFFYGGLVRRKNVLSVIMQCFILLCLISLQWVLFGYSLAFGPDAGGHGLIGNLDWFGLNGVTTEPFAAYSKTVPHQAFMVFQMMFAVITPAVIIGAFAERIRFSAFCVFSVLWATLVYDPIAHWIWSADGFMGVLRPGGWGVLDFAGGTVVEINAGMAALAAAIYLGRRQGFPNKMSPPHNLPFAMLGGALLWFGWFGFNTGSAGGANRLTTTAFVTTHVATAAAGLTWAIFDWIKYRKPTTLGMITGAVSGMVAITPAAGYVTPLGAILLGIGAGVFPWLAVTHLKAKAGYDDSLDVFGVHGVGGIWGVIATGLFATVAVNTFPWDGGSGGNGLFYGNPAQLFTQLKAVGLTVGYSFVMSLGLFWLVDRFLKLRVTDHEERVGLDLTQHKEAGYTVID